MKEFRPSYYNLKITGEAGKEMVFDPVRKKYVRYTPEEKVRQNFIQYLIKEGKYPPGLMSLEVRFRQKNLKNRADILVFSRSGEPVMLVECKAETVELNDQVFDQVIRYNMELKVPFIIVTNWNLNLACRYNIELNKYEQIDFIPLYDEISKLSSE